MTVDVILEDKRWAALDFEALAERAVSTTLQHLDLAADAWDVSILACNDERIAALNTEFRSKPTPTNVLSWPSENRAPHEPGKTPRVPDGDSELGDIAIAYETCLKEAELGGISLEIHTTHLLVHGTLHLLGYDHEDDADADLMEATEIAILASLGVPNPYEG